MTTPRRVLVTGGAGFIGSHLCDRLIRERYVVICLDSLLTGSPANIQHLRNHPAFSFVHGDVTTPMEIEGTIDVVLHFASPASPKDYAQHPIHTLKVGALGTYHSLGLAKAKGAVFVLASSSEVYGDPQVSPQPETYWGHVNPVGPRSVYDEAKRFAEAMAVAYHRVHHLDVRIARIFNTYGPRMRVGDGRVLPTFITQALRGEPLTIYGDGSQTRSFCFISDMVEGIYKLLMLDESQASASNKQEPFIANLGNPDEVTILQLAREVIEVTESSSRTIFCPLPLDDPKVRRPEIAKAKEVLGWSPQVSREDGLLKTTAYFQEKLMLEIS